MFWKSRFDVERPTTAMKRFLFRLLRDWPSFRGSSSMKWAKSIFLHLQERKFLAGIKWRVRDCNHARTHSCPADGSRGPLTFASDLALRGREGNPMKRWREPLRFYMEMEASCKNERIMKAKAGKLSLFGFGGQLESGMDWAPATAYTGMH